MIGRFLCRIGFHRYGRKYFAAGKDWAFGMGHRARNCRRKDCKVTLRYWPD